MRNRNINNNINTRQNIKIFFGSTGLESGAIARTHEKIRGLSIKQCSQTIGYEAQGIEHIIILPTVNQQLEHAGLMSNELVNASLGDYESRLKLAKAGLLWMVDKDFAADPGILDKNTGTGGNIAYGRALFGANRNKFADMFESVVRNTQDYNQQLPYAHDKVGTHAIPGALNIFAISSVAGGTANGARFEAIHTIAEKLKELNINAKIIPVEILIGTLNTGDRKNAALNQLMALKSYQVRLNGKYKEPHYTNGDYQQYCQPPIFISNCNLHGELPDLKSVEAVVAKVLDFYCYEPLGSVMSQEIINLHDKKVKDDTGAYCTGATIGLASINLNLDKINEFLTFSQSYDFFDTLLDSSNASDGQKQAQALFTSVSLKETNSQDLAVQNLLSARNTNYKNVSDKAKSIYKSKIMTNFGFQACEERHYASKFILERQIPSQFIPAIQQEGNVWLDEICRSFNSETAKFLQTINGIPQTTALWEEMLRLTIESDKINKEKLAKAVSNNKSLRSSVSQCEQAFHRLEKRHPILRALSFGLKSFLKRQYPKYTEALIVNELEHTARKLLDEVIYPAVKKLIIAQLEMVNNNRKNALSIKQEFWNKAQRQRNLQNWLYCPNGTELADKELLETKLQQVYEHQKGKKNAMAKIFQMFCGKFNSLDALNTINPEKLKAVIYNHCDFNSQTTTDGLNILDVILDRFSSEQQQYELICQMVARSDGMVKVSGEHNDNIAKKKYICGQDERTINWAVSMANNANRAGGDWTGVVCPGLSEICFLQYRAQISISQLTIDTEKLCNAPTTPAELVKLSDDPFVVTTPEPGCCIDEIDRTIAEGLIARVIRIDNNSYTFIPRLGEPVNLGKSVEQIRKYLQTDHFTICQIHNAFAKYMILNHDNIIEQVKRLCNDKEHALMSQMDVKAREMLCKVTETLLPYAKRVPINND